MYLIGAKGQQSADRLYRLDSTIASGTASQLISPIPTTRAFLFFQNNSSAVMWLGVGGAIATATISGGAVTGCTIVNGGFGYTAPPIIEFMGGAAYCPLTGLGPSGAGLPGYASPNNFPNNAGYRPALARTVLTSGVVTSIVIDDPGSGYVFAPFVDIRNAHSDRYGCVDPFFGSTPNGFQFGPGQSYTNNGTHCSTDQISVYCATVGAAYVFAWAG
jgi:hypothetical protein